MIQNERELAELKEVKVAKEKLKKADFQVRRPRPFTASPSRR